MTIKISELPSLESADLISTPTTVIPLVANTGVENTTYNTTIANIKSYVENGNFEPTGNITVGTITVTDDALISGNLNVSGNLNITGANNLAVTDNVVEVHVANTANVAEPWTYDDGKGIGLRFHWYGSQDENAALVFASSTRTLEWYDTGATDANVLTGTTYGRIKAGNLIIVNTTPTTGNATGSLQTYGGMSATGNIWSGGNVTLTGNVNATRSVYGNNVIATYDIRSTTSNTSGATQVGSLRSNSFATISTTLVTGGTATLNAVNVNGAATVGTTLTTTGTATVNVLASNGNVSGTGASFSGVGQFRAGIQGTAIGNVATGSGKFSTLQATSFATFDGTADFNSTVTIDGTLTTNAIVPFGNANVDIGSVSNQFANVYAFSTRALYADLAEKYIADADYGPGTVVVFGGEQEITITEIPGDTRVAGAISTEPAYVMNSGSTGLEVALRGKVPVKVIGTVYKGDLLVTSAEQGYACAIRNYPASSPNAVFAKSLETNTDQEPRTIWVVIV